MISDSNHRKSEFILSAHETENIPGSAWKKYLIMSKMHNFRNKAIRGGLSVE